MRNQNLKLSASTLNKHEINAESFSVAMASNEELRSRIVDCVNAMHGVHDPIIFVEFVRRLVRKIDSATDISEVRAMATKLDAVLNISNFTPPKLPPTDIL